MAAIGWAALTAGTAALVWLVAAFALRWRHDGRCAATFLAPALLLTALVLRHLMAGEPAVCEAECAAWRRVSIVVSILAGCFAVLPALPVWLVMEQRLGGRAR